MFRDLLNVLKAEIDGRRAWDESIAVQAIDHRFTFSSFMESARHSAGRLRDVGLDKVEVLEAPADGRSIFGDWMMPLAWEVEEATFDLVGSNGPRARATLPGHVERAHAGTGSGSRHRLDRERSRQEKL